MSWTWTPTGSPDSEPSRRELLRLGGMGLTLPGLLSLQDAARAAGPRPALAGFGRAKSCIVLFSWGGMSHLDTFDLKPDAADNIRSQFDSIPTTVRGYRVCEHLPHLAKQAHRMAIVRSMHHRAPSHRSAAYWNLTGHEPPKLDGNWPATRKDWPCLGSMVGRARAPEAGSMPGAVCLPYTMADGGRANGQDGGFMGLADDPVVLRPASGTPYDGVSPTAGAVDLALPDGLSKQRLVSRRGLLRDLEGGAADGGAVKFREMGLNMLLDPAVRRAFDLESEPPALRDRYGRHICGQSVLLARKLSEAGVPLVTVYCAAGDLNGSKGAHWDTHANNFNRLKGQMLPPLDRASSALLDDLAGRGLLEQTLVVWLTEFGRTPKINGNRGRDHFPDCYTVALAGGGIAGGQLYGRSDAIGAKPAEHGASPADLHATVFHALGIDPEFTVYDRENRPYPACDGQALPLFG